MVFLMFTAAAPARHNERGRQARRVAAAWKHSDRHVVCQPHLAHDPRQVGAGQPARCAPSAAARSERARAGKTIPLRPHLTVRDRLAEHRANPACRGCHSLIDPVGFRWRITTRSGAGGWSKRARPIDSTGGLLDGSRLEVLPDWNRRYGRIPSCCAHADGEDADVRAGSCHR